MNDFNFPPRPGVMIYFDILDDLEDYTYEEVGQLFRALLHYGFTGEIPAFSDRGMKTLWRKLQNNSNRDEERYNRKVMNSRYAAYCRWCKRDQETPLKYEAWLATLYIKEATNELIRETRDDTDGDESSQKAL